MNNIIYNLSKVLIFFILFIVVIISAEEELHDNNFELSLNINNSVTNQSIFLTTSKNIENSTNTLSSVTETIHDTSTNYVSTSSAINSIATSFQSSITTNTVQNNVPIASLISFVDQMNAYRNLDILFRIKQCDQNMKLNDLCEMYSIDNKTNLLLRQTNIEFQTLQHISDILVDRMIVQKLNQLCLPNQWCLTNLSNTDIRLSYDVVRERGNSFCFLEQCQSRLETFIETCPILSNKNTSMITLKLLPMLCNLYKEPHLSSIQCIEQIVYLLHTVYAFWPSIEKCYNDINADFDACPPECRRLYDIIDIVQTKCVGGASFLSRVAILELYRTTKLKVKCHGSTFFKRFQFIYSVEKFLSSKFFWNQFHEKPVYAILFTAVLLLSIFSCVLCFYFMSKTRLKSKRLRFGNNYDYNRLHDSSFELGASAESSSTGSRTSKMANDEQVEIDPNDRSFLYEHQRLLRDES